MNAQRKTFEKWLLLVLATIVAQPVFAQDITIRKGEVVSTELLPRSMRQEAKIIQTTRPDQLSSYIARLPTLTINGGVLEVEPNGEASRDGTVTISARRIVLIDAKIVTYGANVTINTNELVAGNAKIIAFETNSSLESALPGESGESGSSGGTVLLNAQSFKTLSDGPALTVDLSGEPGQSGGSGLQGAIGVVGFAGERAKSSSLLPVCERSGSDGGPGGQGGPGGPGGRGGDGGNGGNLILAGMLVKQRSAINFIAEGGKAGLGGDGGPGGKGGPGGRGGDGSPGCGGGNIGPSGPSGAAGPKGPDGRPGEPGSIRAEFGNR